MGCCWRHRQSGQAVRFRRITRKDRVPDHDEGKVASAEGVFIKIGADNKEAKKRRTSTRRSTEGG
jgi:hypothetical protein